MVLDLRHCDTDGRFSPLESVCTAPSHFQWAWLEIALDADFADSGLLPHGCVCTRFKAEMLLVAAISPQLHPPRVSHAGATA